MIEKKRIACFFTAGYTELNAMKSFMKKINDKVEYIQLCPNGSRRSKDAIKNRHTDTIAAKQSGLTGEGLINYILDFVGKNRFLEEHYDAILIEDDKDRQFLRLQPDGTASIDEDAWTRFQKEVTEQVNAKCPEIPVLFFYAAPEVEAWFLSDWDNSFGKVYKNTFNTQQNDYFSVKFRKYVNDNILMQRYKNSVEAYGYFNNTYKKLSGEIQKALNEIDFLNDYMPALEHEMVHYSKRKQGEAMLAEIDPQTVLRHCTTFFKSGMLALQSL